MLDCCTILAARRETLVRYCTNYLGSWEDAEDVMQTTALKAWHAWDRQSFADERAAVAWLYRIAHNECLDELRRRGCRPQSAGAFDDLLNPAPMDVEATVLGHERFAAINDALLGLSPTARAMVLLTAYECPQREIGARLGYTRSAVKSAVTRARALMRRQIERAA